MTEVTVCDLDGNEVVIEVPDFERLACDSAEEMEPEVLLSEGSSFIGTPYEEDHADVYAEIHAGWVSNGTEEDAGGDIQTGSDLQYGLFELAPEPEKLQE